MVPSNNLASPPSYETVQQEFDQEKEEERIQLFEKLLQEPVPSFDSGSNQHPGIQFSSENVILTKSDEYIASRPNTINWIQWIDRVVT